MARPLALPILPVHAYFRLALCVVGDNKRISDSPSSK